MNKEILCAEFIKEHFRYDPETGFIYKIKGRNCGNRVGCETTYGYQMFSFRFNNKKYSFYNHRAAWLLTFGKFPDNYIDHIDHDKTNNKLSNLRECTIQENGFNRLKQNNRCDSIYKGVAYHKRDDKWQASIMINKKLKFIGYFNNEKEAALAYDKMALENYKEFAALNFPL